MKKIAVLFLSLLFVFLWFSTAPAATVGLYDWAFNVDGTIYEDANEDSMPTTGSLTDGLGTLTWSTSVAGDHSFIAFFDHEIDEATNTFYNEYGETVNTPEATQSWEIDEPWGGDIYDHVLAGLLDNTNDVPVGSEDDVSWAMGWDFNLASGYQADFRLILSNDINDISTFGFYMEQVDPDSNETIYFSSDYIVRETEVIPEPATMILLGTGLAGLLGIRRKKFRK